MQENSNKILAINSIILYIRMGVSVLCSLFIARFALQALGVNDFGLFSVVGSVITFVSLINTVMLSTTNRYLAVSLGTNNIIEVNKVFNVCLVIHILIAIITAIFAIPLGEWYIYHYVNYNGPIGNALMVYRFSIAACILSFISVPYNGFLIAKEKFIVFCCVDIISHILKLVASVMMLYLFKNKLLFYASMQSVLTAYPIVIYWLYCRRYYREIVRWHPVRNKSLYKEMIGFSGWVGFGALTTIAKSQAAQLLVNAFFNTVMNAALGIANTINTLITTVASNITQPIAPQMTKSYAAGDIERCTRLLVISTKFSFFLMLLVSSPLFSNMDWVIRLWLGEAPPYVALFTKLLILDVLVSSFNSGISTIVFANGKIAFYQITINVMNIISVVLAFIFLKLGAPVYIIFYVYIACTIVKLFWGQMSLHRIGNIAFNTLLKESYLPSILVALLYLPIHFIKIQISPLLHIIIVFIYLLILILTVGINKREKKYLLNVIKGFIYNSVV